MTNRSPYNLSYGEVSCKVNYYNSRGDIIESNDLFITDIDAYSSKSSMTHASSNSVKTYKIIKDVIATDGLKSKVKDQIIRNTGYGCDTVN